MDNCVFPKTLVMTSPYGPYANLHPCVCVQIVKPYEANLFENHDYEPQNMCIVNEIRLVNG